ncbi:hypothetical protein [Salinibacterium sp. PAMC 21357]|uniref:hypothetical protein n=1 Tax=Salinibacterium sp. PAMC 21357 TaxID=1112215 RepID=UPI000288F8B5|nr:hypothetical protein [Salinibacterium sp. PAMC 21357]
MPPEVAATFNDYPELIRGELLVLRDLILATASETDGVGAITETLKWGEPAYLTKETRSGSTIRIAPTNAKSAHDYAMFFICSTNLVSDFEPSLATPSRMRVIARCCSPSATASRSTNCASVCGWR